MLRSTMRFSPINNFSSAHQFRRNFPFLLLALLLLSSCALKTTKNLVEQSPDRLSIVNPYFSDPARDYLYKAKIDAYGRSFGGIAVIKKIGDNHHRVAFTTEFGNKIFDFEFQGQTFKINFILEDLNKKLIINVLKKDFQILLQEVNQVVGKFISPEMEFFQSPAGKHFNFFGVSTDTGLLEKIIHTTRRKEKILFALKISDNHSAQSISIQHLGIPLNIDLKAF